MQNHYLKLIDLSTSWLSLNIAHDASYRAITLNSGVVFPVLFATDNERIMQKTNNQFFILNVRSFYFLCVKQQ